MTCLKVIQSTKEMDKYFKIAQIIAKSFLGSLSAEEQQLLNNWRQQSPRNESLYHDLADSEPTNSGLEQINRFKQHQRTKTMSWQRKPVVFHSWQKFAAAAAVLFIAVLSGIWLFQSKPNALEPMAESSISVAPGKSGAVLTLASGEKVVLDEQMADSLQLDSTDSQAAFVANRQISYQLQQQDAELATAASEQLVYNTLEVPVKAEYRLVLSDGTRVTLNAGSSLRFPVKFGKGKRQVEVRGEAYFEVVHEENRPFEVLDSFGNRIEDLGTSFNVKAYSDEANHEVALVEGEIIFHASKGESKALQPGNGIEYTSAGAGLKLKEIDVTEVTAWKDGRFVFNDKPLSYVFSNISRWYGVAFELDNPAIGEQHFTIDIPKYENLSTIISMLETTGTIHFRKEGAYLKVYTE